MVIFVPETAYLNKNSTYSKQTRCFLILSLQKKTQFCNIKVYFYNHLFQNAGLVQPCQVLNKYFIIKQQIYKPNKHYKMTTNSKAFEYTDSNIIQKQIFVSKL